MNTGNQPFVWDGKDANGYQWPDGNYKMTISAKDTSGNPVTVSTTVQGTVDSVDLSSTPPTLSIGDNKFTTDKIKSVVRPGL
jgi:flagellar basal-body rod modification protein FlgD